MSVAVPDRRVTAPKPQRGRRGRGAVAAPSEPVTPPAAGHYPPAHRELRWIRHRNEWVVELVVVVPDGSGLAPV